jgi:hypothetical protein
MSVRSPVPITPRLRLRTAGLTGLGALLLVLAANGAPVAGAPPPAPLGERVDAALARAVQWLVEEQEGTGSWDRGPGALGPTALAVLALQHAGVEEGGTDRAARALRRAWMWLELMERRRVGTEGANTGTYARAFLRLALDRRARPQDRAWCQRLTGALVSSQAANGQWGYETPTDDPGPAGDNSNAQIAALALATAAAAGDAVPRATLERAADWWREHPQADGGFGYASGGGHPSATTGSMTAAGIASLAALAVSTGRVDPTALEAAALLRAAEPVLDRAADRLAEGFRIDRNEGPTAGRLEARRAAGRGWLHYYLWSVERAMVLLGESHIGDLDWYTAGAEHLLGTQTRDGAWRGERPLYATCFGILFLTRAADPPRAFTARPSSPVTPRAPEAGADAPREPPVFDGEVAYGVRAGVALPALLDACRRRGATSLVPIVALLDAPDRRVRQRAHEVLVALVPPERSRGVATQALARGRLALWLRRFGEHLVLVDGRFEL